MIYENLTYHKYFNITNNNINHQLKGYSTYWTKNNLLHHCISDKDRYIHVVTLYTRAVFFSTSDRASKEVRNTREPDLRVA